MVNTAVGLAEEHIADAARALLDRGQFRLQHRPGLACRVRLASFTGRVDPAHRPDGLTITLGHMLHFIQERLAAYRSVLHSAHFGAHCSTSSN
ncbi:MAG: hypothetical protein QN152_08960 [Armatimonadota bacterium]|nr:hypothetical protein [Armatimonadota bacterium]MDR7426493.1 hypothetical protein [Armatimonadota bacterium]MDR7463390.1 hypothetical protein [Armatimonadota bacterium]MDR7468555.1 hypothetical protein [Armatimonadota bacterium]MDR7475148.1 hypothetical protein [Armatimonadota bacterium]